MRVFVVFVVGLTCLCWSNDCVFGMAKSGPYDIKIQSAGACPEEAANGKNTIPLTTKLQRISRKKLIVHVNASLVTGLSDDQKILVNQAKMTSQGWKDNYFITEVPAACTFLLSLPSIKSEITKLYKIASCPIPAGNYSISVDLSMNSFPRMIPIMEYGKARARIFLRQKSETLSCLEIFLEYVPQHSG